VSGTRPGPRRAVRLSSRRGPARSTTGAALERSPIVDPHPDSLWASRVPNYVAAACAATYPLVHGWPNLILPGIGLVIVNVRFAMRRQLAARERGQYERGQ
jgi:hypothetical protein